LLLLLRKWSKEAAKSNSILSNLADAYEKLSHIYAPKAYPISYLAHQLNCSEQEVVAILKAGPFIESAPGVWEIDQHFGKKQHSSSEQQIELLKTPSVGIVLPPNFHGGYKKSDAHKPKRGPVVGMSKILAVWIRQYYCLVESTSRP